jgi:hypothetical protein
LDRWECASDIVRLSQIEGTITINDLKLLLLSDRIHYVLLSEEARSLYQHAPTTVELMDMFMMVTESLEDLTRVPRPTTLKNTEQKRRANNNDIEHVIERYKSM